MLMWVRRGPEKDARRGDHAVRGAHRFSQCPQGSLGRVLEPAREGGARSGFAMAHTKVEAKSVSAESRKHTGSCVRAT